MKTYIFRIYTKEIIRCRYGVMIEAETFEEAIDQFKERPLQDSTLEKEYLIDANEEGYYYLENGEEKSISELNPSS